MMRGGLAVVCVAFPGGMRCRPDNCGEVFRGQSRPDTCGEVGDRLSLFSVSPRHLMAWGFLSVVCVAFLGGMRCRPYNYGEACLGPSRPNTCGEVGVSVSRHHLMALLFPLPSLVFVAASSHDAGFSFCCLCRPPGRHEMPPLQLRGDLPRAISPRHLRDGRGPPVAVLCVAAPSYGASCSLCLLFICSRVIS